jgi:hypothetical protein
MKKMRAPVFPAEAGIQSLRKKCRQKHRHEHLRRHWSAFAGTNGDFFEASLAGHADVGWRRLEMNGAKCYVHRSASGRSLSTGREPPT